jgi:hypothetical protein
MLAWTSLLRVRGGALAAALLCLTSAARAGHEVSYYPSFYPQEIRIEPLDPSEAAKEFVNTADPLHAYIGHSPRFSGEAPPHLKSIASLRSFIVASVNAQRVQDRQARCRALERAAEGLATQPDVVIHRYPVTPYHADYIGHVDRTSGGRAILELATTRTSVAADKSSEPLTFDSEPSVEPLLAPDVRRDSVNWDMRFAEVAVDELRHSANTGSAVWLPPPWAKEGWFQAYHLLRSVTAVGEPGAREPAETIYTRLTHADFKDETERVNLERQLITALSENCERAVVGYRLRREFYNDDFSNGIENILVDSQTGFNSPVFIRTVKLKDLPWNGWLRLGIEGRATAAWNPVAGFTDASGRLVWSTVGDDAFLPIPHNSRWVPNRVEIRPDEDAKPRQSVRIPADAVMAEPGSGRITPVGTGKGAMAKVTYRVIASSFHDGTEMEAADLLYPYALAFRWGAGADGALDPDIAAATRLLREGLKGVRIVRTEERTLQLADLTFTYRSPIVEVYLDSLDAQDSAVLAPPWSAVPWHVLALMEAAVERGIAAFSQREAQRRGIAWLDLVRDEAQLAQLKALIKEFAQAAYRPAALEGRVSPEAARARWEALDKFVQETGHLLVTNGPYRLKRWSPDSFVFDVVREFTYPIGIGTFDTYAYPPRALITSVVREGNRIVVTADAETAVKQQRDRRIVRTALKRDTLRETLPLHPVPRYVIVADRSVVATGSARWEADGRFTVSLPPLHPGSYTFFAAVFLDGNTIAPAIGRLDFRE